MHKHLITLGTAVLLICVGLSGCVDDNDEISNPITISIDELKNHPNRYLNNLTSTKAFFGNSGMFGFSDNRYVIYTTKWNGAFDSLIDILISDDIDKELLMNREEYIFTGILRYGEFIAYNEENMRNDIYFEIKSVNLVYQDDSNTVTLKKISEHPASYIKRSITIKGIISNDFSYITDEFDRWSDIRMDIITNNVDTSMLIPGGEYYFTGVLKLQHTHISIPASRYDIHKGTIIEEITFDVEKIVPV